MLTGKKNIYVTRARNFWVPPVFKMEFKTFELGNFCCRVKYKHFWFRHSKKKMKNNQTNTHTHVFSNSNRYAYYARQVFVAFVAPWRAIHWLSLVTGH